MNDPKLDVLGCALVRRAKRLGFNPASDLTELETGYAALDYLEKKACVEGRHLKAMAGAPISGVAFEVVRERPDSVLAHYVAYKRKFETVEGYEVPFDAEGWLSVPLPGF